MEIKSLPEKKNGEFEFYKDLFEVHKELPAIIKKKKINGRSTYANLDDMLEEVLPILHKHGIMLEQEITYTTEYIHCVNTKLRHVATGFVSEFSSLVPIREEDFIRSNINQVHGSGYTYVKRYALGSKLGLRFEEDTDGNIPEREEPRFKKPYAPVGKNTGPLTNMFPD